MNINIRLETPEDYYEVELLTREAFWGFTNPTCDEHYLIHLLRNADVFIRELDFVAEFDGKLIGNVMYSRAKIVDKDGIEHEVLTFGPLSVLPEYWNCGIGSALMKHSILEAKRLGYGAIVFHGHPDYYPRFGFQNAGIFNITNNTGQNYDALMAMELYADSFIGISGKFYESQIFEINAEDAEKYNLNFPQKEPAKMISINVLLEKLPSVEIFTNRGITDLAWLNRLSGREMLLWEGVNDIVLKDINEILKKYGYSEKLLPDSDILLNSKLGINVLSE